jgi:Fe-S oxidoreductase
MKLARAAIQLFEKAGVSYGVIGNEEKCCGEMVRKCGDEESFQSLCTYNTDLFQSRGAKKIVVTSPHCLYTFKNEYPGLEEMEILHTSQLFDRLITGGGLKPVREIQASVAYHDPCYLGRHSDIYDPPRNILQSIPGLTLIEMDRNRQESLCCGGGGGRMWSETPIEERFSLLRIEEALECGADILATACPFCVLRFEDILQAKPELNIKIRDVSELLAESLDLEDAPKIDNGAKTALDDGSLDESGEDA